MDAIEELVMVKEISAYFADIADEDARNKLFITVFQVSSSRDHRLEILSRLLSLAVATHNVSVLESAAVWMQVGL